MEIKIVNRSKHPLPEYNMFLFNNLYELLTIVSNLFHRKKIDFELWKTVSNLYKCFEIKMNSFLGYSGEISNKS